MIIKDHKEANEEGGFPNRLIPANNSTSAFPRLGYLGIKRIFDSKQIEYERHTISQASNLKEGLEKSNVKKKDHTTGKLVIIEMYPSLQFRRVRKAVTHFLTYFSV